LGRGPISRREARTRHWNRSQLIRRHRGLCAGCSKPVNLIHGDPLQATIDHVVPIALGGRHVLGNMQLLCAACNRAKGATPPELWQRFEESA
jgi:5-methylcytosine-specific restriction endonuclease McrA